MPPSTTRMSMPADPYIIFLQGGPATARPPSASASRNGSGSPTSPRTASKEPIFDHVGVPVAWDADDPLAGSKMDAAAMATLFYLIECQAKARRPCIVDSTFEVPHASVLVAIHDRHPFLCIQVHCRAEADELARRYRRRAQSGERHPGHLDQLLAADFDAERLGIQYPPLDLPGHLLAADTTRYTDADFETLVSVISAVIESDR